MKTSPIRGTVSLVLALAPVALATTFTVTNVNDGGAGSLRDAINQANLDPLAPVIIDFNVPPALLTPPGPGGVAVIQPLTPLPVIQNVNGLGIRIDGYTQPGSSFAPGSPSSLVVKVELDGSLIPVPYVAPPPNPQYAHGIYIMSSNNRVQGLCVHSFPHDGISIQGIVPQPPPPDGNGHPGSNMNMIYWNLVGTDVTGTVALPNGHDQTPVSGGLWGGIYVKVVPGSGPAVANQNHILENVASGNTIEGVGISSCPPGDVQRNHVERCYAGIDITGTGPLGNGHQGIYIGESAHHNVLDQNWVGANGYDGVGIVGYAPTNLITHSNTLIRNRIGVDVNLNPMPNQWHGVAIGSYGGAVWGFAPSNVITNNVIANNGHAGVAVTEDPMFLGDNDTSYNTITQNSIYDNGPVDPGDLGIDLDYEPGVTPNDPGDGDQGSNELVNFPENISAIYSLGTTTVSGSIDTPNMPVVIEVFTAKPDPSGYGEGAVYLGSTTTNIPNWSVAVTGGALPGQLITATATDAAGNTSEFALNEPVWDENQQPVDYGDAPDPPYFTLALPGGPAHQIVPGMYLGQSVDGEPDGQPDATATGDDNDGNDDEDGVTFPVPLVPGQVAQIDVVASMVGWIDAWVDFDGDGNWHSTEQIVTNGLHNGGGTTTSFAFNVPPGAVVGPTFARVRYSSGGNLLPYGPGPGGINPDGEVEDEQVTIYQGQEELDWGDAPDVPGAMGYRTLAANGGANHFLAPGVFLGNGVDPEPDGQPHPHAMGDDNSIFYGGFDDEDGVMFTSPVVLGGTVTLQVQASVAGFLNAWLDFNCNGTWEPFEKVFAGQPVAAGITVLSFPVPAAAVPGSTYARFRFNTQVLSLPPGGPAPDGEVEDYAVEIEDGSIPHKMHWAQLPDPIGWDVRGYEPKILADDFRCTESGPITRITFWGSWQGDTVGEIKNVHLSIHEDDRSGAYSRPGPLLWEANTADGMIGFVLEDPEQGEQGWFDPNTGQWEWPDHHLFFKYTVDIPPDIAFWQEEGTIYWLDIQVTCTDGHWGWKTSRSAHFEDDAVWDDTPQDPPDWRELIDPRSELSLDLAFVIAGEEPQAIDWGDAPDDLANPNDYPTWSASNGASHIIATDPTGIVYQMGNAIDAEPDGQPTLAADGDDINPPIGIDDEDGVSFMTALIPGVAAAVQVQASTAGFLNAWIDLNANADWVDPGEWFLSDLPVSAGTNTIGFVVPAGTPPGPTYLRFRFTSQPLIPLGLNEGGQAPDGEVEDYQRRIEEPVEVDWGDAPDDPTNPSDYPTLVVSDGARHVIVPGYQMGANLDGEPDGQPDPQALGDDNNLVFPGGPDDEDGVFFYPLVIGQLGAMDVTVSGGAGFIDAWVDFNIDGDWADPGEQVAASAPVGPGLNQILFGVPAGIAAGPTFARVRFSSGGGLAPTGMAPDGEVEDHEVKILPEGEAVYDFGDALDPLYPTLSASNGARHLLGGPVLGALIDAEPDGQPDPNALGDDLNVVFPGGPDDEDGVSFPYPLIAGMPNVVVVTASAPGRVDAWVDFDNNGVWAPGPVEQILVSVPVNPGTNILPIIVPPPAGVGAGPTFARFRISSAGGLAPTGFAQDGEVEDHLVMVFEDGKLDWGDAPDPTYPTLMANLGAAHWITALFLGGGIDAEPDGQPDPTATGDDLAGIDDEDGIGFTTEWISGYNADITVTASQPGTLQAWADLDGDGTWLQSSEVIIAGVPVGAGITSFTIPVPAGIGPMNAFARFRLTPTGVGVGYDGYVQGGEVEDYMVPVGKRIGATIQVTPGGSPTTVTLNWTAEPGATQYSVYSSTTLAGPFPSNWTLEASGIAGTTWNQAFAGPRKFYIVVAFP